MRPRDWAAFAAVTLIWGSTWLVIRYQLGVVPPTWSVSYRFLLAGALMLGWCWLSGRPLALPRAAWWLAAVVGLMLFVGNFNFVYRAEHYVTSGLVAVAFALLIVPNALIARVWLGRRITPRFALGALVGIAGVMLLFAQEARTPTGGLPGESRPLLGIGLTLMGVLAASVANVAQATPRAAATPSFTLLGWAMLGGGLVNTGLAWAMAGPPVFDPSPVYVGGLLMLAALASAVAFGLYFGLIQRMGPAEAAWISVLVPLVAMALSTAFEGYRWTGLSVAGSVLAFAGLVVAMGGARRP